ncbi:DUF6441 family protein [Minwuia thermotolerans]|uniref:Uncharacterized protein n=1 Tax=Minwuia thermotolerans TaxID=2056226 RepID=A0A2M9G2K2_9PROT|nr:DUF6441 family protein [Minwuia thermotolerans]PJK29952.1 hypothetical protein CVT23_09295 [Minwuia thermotolerans]
MRLEAAIRGDLKKIVSAEVRQARRAINAGMREAGKGLRDDMKAHVRQAGLGKFATRWVFRVNRPREPMDMSVAVFPRGTATRTIIGAFDTGGIIRPKQGRYLAIPTDFNRKDGRRGGKVLKQIDELDDAFVQRSRSGTLIVFSRVRLAQEKMQDKVRVRDLAFAEGRLLGSGRRRRTHEFLAAGIVPMFVLKPSVRMPKRLDLDRVKRPWDAKLPRLIVEHWEKESRRART